MRRAAGALCLILALYCLVAAAATLSAQTVTGERASKTFLDASRSRLPLLLPINVLVFLVVVAAVMRPGLRRTGPSTPARPE
ncbi:MAG TPA: hypothetical protein VGW35_20760 [Methylomirabilota bacterium]|nr:hypothetical protein [Methylomirabilota bacterium]